MIDKIIQSIKDPSRRSYPLAVLFFIMIVVSAFYLYSLPQNLVIKGSMTDHGLATGVYIQLYAIIGVTFLVGIAALNYALNSKKEIIVFQERKKSETATQEDGSTGENTESVDVSVFRKTIAAVRNENERLQTALNLICKVMEAGQGALYLTRTDDGRRSVELNAHFAMTIGESEVIKFEFGEGLIGQSASSATSLYIDEVPEGYINIISGLGSAQPRYLFITPIKKGEVMGVIEAATFSPVSEKTRKQVESMAQVIAESLTTK